jgi:6-pyruvoyltetrahydropterin/6-carboxytetrahydropterin synthase
LQDEQGFKVRVQGMQWAAGHFATFGRQCEPLHGHNYEVAAEAEGSLTRDSWVVDFGVLKSLLREFTRDLEHKFMLQRDSRILEIDETETAWKVRTPANVGYVLPKSDVVALPIDNTTAERLAQWLCERLWRALAERGAPNLRSLMLEVWEAPGQSGSYRRQK